MGGFVPDIVIHTLRPSTKVCLTNLAHSLISCVAENILITGIY